MVTRWEKYWQRRDNAQAIFHIVGALILIACTVTNITVTYRRNDGHAYTYKDIAADSEALLTNLQILVGNETVYLIEFFVLLCFKTSITVIFSLAVCRYAFAKSNVHH